MTEFERMRGGFGISVLVHVGEHLQQKVLEPKRVVAEPNQLWIDCVVDETMHDPAVIILLLHRHIRINHICIDRVLLLVDNRITQVINQNIISAFCVQRERLRLILTL